MSKRLQIGLLILFSFFLSRIWGENYLDLISTLTGPFNNSLFGSTVVSLDFNGDNFDDLIVKCSYWTPTGIFDPAHPYGRIYFYWGGTEFDNVPDFIIDGQVEQQFLTVRGAGHMSNAGDMNGDGIDDLITPYKNDIGQNCFAVYFGRAVPRIEPDRVFITQIEYPGNVYPLGDINGDRKDDVALSLSDYPYPLDAILIWDNVWGDPYFFRSTNSGLASLIGVNDVNNDGIDDCYLSLSNYGEYRSHIRQVLYMGNELFPQTDSLVISEDSESCYRAASPVGDVNGDGFADFIGSGYNLWLGSPDPSITPDINMIFNTPYHYWANLEYNVGIPVVYGDLNGDGYDDMIGSNHIMYYWDGEAAIWLGGPNVNGRIDMYLSAPQIFRNYGFSKAAGDYNGDGLCDVAISAPFWGQDPDPNISLDPGKVYVYSGNTLLEDTTVGVEEDIIPVIDNKMQVYPNPFKHSTTIEFSIPETDNVCLNVYNLRGQNVRTLITCSMERGQHKIVWDGKDDKGSSIASGIYFIRMQSGGKSYMHKVLVVK